MTNIDIFFVCVQCGWELETRGLGKIFYPTRQILCYHANTKAHKEI